MGVGVLVGVAGCGWVVAGVSVWRLVYMWCGFVCGFR